MTKIYAHRGASGYAPENTLEAFALAAEQGAQGVELDVHLSKDGEVVVAHDEQVDRVSDGEGLLVDMTVAELKKLTFSRVMPEFAPCRMPTLREVYALLKPTGLEVNVELKTNAIAYEDIERKCVDLAAEMGMTERVLYSSFNHYSLLKIKEIDRSLPCGLLYEATMVWPWKYAKEIGMEALHPHFYQLMVPSFTHNAHKEKILVNPWTVNREEDLRWVFDCGADIVITNYPDRALEILRERG